MLKLSTGLMNSLLGDNGNNQLEKCHTEFLSGDRAALMSALITCSLYQQQIPDWVADELLTLDEKLSSNQITDMNEFFNFEPTHKAKQGVENNIIKNEKKVLSALFNHRIDGGNLTAGDGLEEVAESSDVSRRLVVGVYKKNKDFIKSLPKNREEKNTGYVHSELPSLLECAKFRRNQKK